MKGQVIEGAKVIDDEGHPVNIGCRADIAFGRIKIQNVRISIEISGDKRQNMTLQNLMHFDKINKEKMELIIATKYL